MTDLRELGLSSYEDRAYRSLLGLGSVSATELSDVCRVPSGRIYDVLDDLETRGLVRAQTHSRPKQYVAVEPEIAIRRLVETRTQELTAEIERMEVLGNQLISDLVSAETVDEPFWTTAIGTEDAIELLYERIDVADERIIMIADVYPPQFDIAEVGSDLLERLAGAIQREVDVSLLLPSDLIEEVPHGLINRIESEPFTDSSFAVRTTDRLYGDVFLIDHVELCFEVVNPMERNAVVGLVNVKDPSFALELESQFQSHWKEANPFPPRPE